MFDLNLALQWHLWDVYGCKGVAMLVLYFGWFIVEGPNVQHLDCFDEVITGLSNRTSSRLPDVGDVIRSRTSGRPVGRSIRRVKLHLHGGYSENFTPLDFYADDVAA